MRSTPEKLPLPAVVLAAGAGRRFGRDKLLATYRGRPLLKWTLEKWNEHPLVESIILVVQPQSREIASIAMNFSKVRLAENPGWDNGMGSSISVGVAAVQGQGVLVGLADTPFFSNDTLEMIVPNPGETQNIRVPLYNGVPGHPKYFPNWTFAELKALDGDEGAKSIIARHRVDCQEFPCEDSGILRDFDRREDFSEIV